MFQKMYYEIEMNNTKVHKGFEEHMLRVNEAAIVCLVDNEEVRMGSVKDQDVVLNESVIDQFDLHENANLIEKYYDVTYIN